MSCCGGRAAWLVAAVVAPALAWSWPRPGIDAGSAARVTAAAREFLAGLDLEDRAKASFAFDDAERTTWNFVPGVYAGVPLASLDLAERRLLRALLATALSTTGQLKLDAIAHRELELRAAAEAAGRTAEVPTRDPERYAVAIFGRPGEDLAFGIRYQGHHASLNITIAADRGVAVTPLFLGANPHELRTGPFAGQRVLGDQEDAARALLAALDPSQRDAAVLAKDAPPDILVGPGRTADLVGAPKGVAYAELDATRQALLRALVATSVDDLDPALAAAQRARLAEPDGLPSARFAWLGSTEPGAPHYFRVHGKGFLIEYDNTQNGANHSHRVWHDLRDGFGADLLRAHLDAAHGKR